jgi:DNA polymerase-1
VSRLANVQLHRVDSLDDARSFLDWAWSVRDRPIGVDSESTGFFWHRGDYVRTVQVGDHEHGWCLRWDRWSGLLESLLKVHTGPLDMMNSKFDYAFLRKAGVELDKSRVRDVGVMSHILEPHMSRALKNQAKRHVDPNANALQYKLDEALGAHGGWTWATVPYDFQPYWSYSALDPVLTRLVAEHHWPLVQAQAPKAYELENAFQWVALGMETLGTPVDVEYASQHYEKFMDYCRDVEIWCLREYNVKPGSNAAVIDVLAKAGFEFSKATKSGAVALDKEVLEGIDHPLAQAVLRRRQLQKIASTYLEFYVENADADGRIHPSINTLGARTSRMSMSEPNFQNLPVRGGNPAVKVVRNCVRARPGHTLVFSDFDQVEMRGLAIMSGDPGLAAAFHSPEDFFVNLARTVYQDSSIEKSDPRRQVTKNTGYGKIYGAGVAKLALTAGIDQQQAAWVTRTFDAAYPKVAEFQHATFSEAMQHLNDEGIPYTTCPLTGRRHVADRGKEYALVNYKIQGWAAALFKTKLLEADAAGLGEFMILPVHDEVILEVPNDQLKDVVHTLRKVMNDDESFAVPISASVAVGERWGEKRELGEDEL